jgi:hypothetical protein
LSIDKEKRRVAFSLKDYRKGGQKTTLILSTKEFIRRFQLHILSKGFTLIRHYGFLSSSWKKEELQLTTTLCFRFVETKYKVISQHN